MIGRCRQAKVRSWGIWLEKFGLRSVFLSVLLRFQRKPGKMWAFKEWTRALLVLRESGLAFGSVWTMEADRNSLRNERMRTAKGAPA